MNETDIQAVRETLQQFQDGYTRRDVAAIQEFRELFVSDDDIELIGTGAIETGDDEWCLGIDASCDLVQNDWEGWGDLTLDVEDARIHVLGDVAWLATTGTVQMDLEPEDVYGDYLLYIKELVTEETDTPRDRLIEILRGGTNTLFEAERGKEYLWPVRFTAVLVRRPATDGNSASASRRWQFHQIQFSFATTRFPDVRNT